jgi:stage II sporulation protein AA (anti-sigma F factor antagonist)
VLIRTQIDAKIRELMPKRTVFDLEQINFMDSSGLGLVMGRYALMQRIGGELTVRNPNKRIMKIFDMAGMSKIISIEQKKGNSTRVTARIRPL